MIQGRPVTIFAVYDGMWSLHYTVILVAVAVLAVFTIKLIFYLKGLPFLFVAFSVPAIHITPFPYSEVLWNNELSRNQYENNQAHRNIKGPPDMTLHCLSRSVMNL